MAKWTRRRTRWVVGTAVLVAVLSGFYALGRHSQEQERRAKAAGQTVSTAPSAPVAKTSSAPPPPVASAPVKVPTSVPPKSEPPKAPASTRPAEVPPPATVPGRPLQPVETTTWAKMLRADDAKAPGRPQLADYELAFSTATRMCAQQPDEIVKLTRRLATKKSPLFDGDEGRAYSALGWMASVESRPQSDCSTAGADMQ